MGKRLLKLADRALDLLADLERIGARLQEDADQRGGLAVDAADEVVVLRAELDARHVVQAQRAAVGVGAHDDLLELPAGPRAGPAW